MELLKTILIILSCIAVVLIHNICTIAYQKIFLFLSEQHYQRSKAYQEHNPKEAIKLLKNALIFQQKLHTKTLPTYIYQQLGTIYLRQKKCTAAIHYYKKSLIARLKKGNLLHHQRINYYLRIAYAYHAAKNNPKATLWVKRAQQLRRYLPKAGKT